MDNIELIRNYEHGNIRHRFKYHESANLIEWEVLVRRNWLQKIFNTKGQTFFWKRVYFGHVTPIEVCLETYQRGQEAQNFRLNKKNK